LSETEKAKWDELYQRGVTFETEKNYSAAVEQYLEALEIDDSYADICFRLGRCYWEMGEYDQSREQYIRARDMDTLRFRADNRINEIIREVAGEKTSRGVYLVDACEVFEKNSPHDIPGDELFYEHVHMNFEGNSLLAVTIFQQAEKILPERINRETAEGKPLASEEECARYLAYNGWIRQKTAEKVLNEFLKKPPFTNQLYHDERIIRKEQELRILRDALTPEVINQIEQEYRWAIGQTQSDPWLYWKYGLMLEDLQKFDAALAQFHKVTDLAPNHYEAYARLGFMYGAMGDLDTALKYNLKAVNIYPSFSEAYYNLGLAYQLKGMYNKAVESYSNSIRIIPQQPGAYNNLAVVLYEQGKVTEALETYRNGLKFVPDDLNLHYNLGVILKAQGRIDEAGKELRIAMKIDPNSAKVRKVLRSIEGLN
jgi:tetratricopeptide (TPR) repeat protein